MFDIKEYINIQFFDSSMHNVCKGTKFLVTEPLARGKLCDVIDYNPYFETTLPDRLGLPKVDDNIAEGVVIKPIKDMTLNSGKRIIIKKKNERFAEITGVVKTKKKICYKISKISNI